MKVPLKVVPGASKDEISGWLGERLKVRVRAPAESGRANRAVIKIVAAKMGLKKRALRIVAGSAAAQKLIEIDELTEAEFQKRLRT